MKPSLFFATCPKGLEQLLEEELQQLGATFTKQTVAGVTFKSTMELVYKICLWSRLANRILLPLATFPVNDQESLYMGVSQIQWDIHMTTATTFLVNFTGVSENIKHTQFAAQKVKDAIVDQFRQKTGHRPSVAKENPMLRINALLRKGQVTISIDLSGDSLHRRGYRQDGGAAPLKENLAAALLYRSKWPEVAKEGGMLLDPMCGSATLLIEGFLIAADIAPGLLRRSFGFQGWRLYDDNVWKKVLKEAQERAEVGKTQIKSTFQGYDSNFDYLCMAEENIKRAGLTHHIQVKKQELKALSSSEIYKLSGLLIVNPPYGERLDDDPDLPGLYQLLGKKIKENFLNWEAAIFTGNPELSRTMGLRAYKKYALYNGTISCQLLLFHVQPEWFIDK